MNLEASGRLIGSLLRLQKGGLVTSRLAPKVGLCPSRQDFWLDFGGRGGLGSFGGDHPVHLSKPKL